MRALVWVLLLALATVEGSCAPVESGSAYVLTPHTSLMSAADAGLSMHTNHLINTGPAGGLGPGGGMTPAQIQSFYNLPSSGGAGVIAVIDAYDYPTSLNDFNVFASEFGLPVETSADPTSSTNQVFQVVYASGTQPTANADWSEEAALDIEWAHAIAPNAKIVLVEANTDNTSDMMAAVDAAGNVNIVPNVGQISMSWGSSEFPGESGFDYHFQQGNGIVYLAASGDLGGATIWPAACANVVAVGGTSVATDESGNLIVEMGWGGSGGGPAIYESKGSYQVGVWDAPVSRGVPDVSSDSDPASGVSVYDSTDDYGYYGWLVFGGTSVATPCVAGMVNLAQYGADTTEELTQIYAKLGTPSVRDITYGTAGNYSCLPGWDFVTGVGSPIWTVGSLTVMIGPSDVDGQALWRLTNGPDTNWHQSGDTISNIPSGIYTLTFSSVSGWNSPPDETLTISGSSSNAVGTYVGVQNVLGIPGSEYNALVALYDSTNGPSWTNHTNWFTSNPAWYGVSVSGGHVIKIVLENNQLTGSLPPQLSGLTALQTLEATGNQLTGAIPAELGSMTSLTQLDLGGNQLANAIPTQLGNLANLQTLDLDNNQLTDEIPVELGNLTSLTRLDLSGNQLMGTIPSQLEGLVNLQTLKLDKNQLFGEIPTWLGNTTALQALDLDTNQLSGAIPTQLGNLIAMQTLDLSWNQLTGAIPASLGNLTKLTQLHLDNNDLSGTMPSQLGNLTALQTLDFDNNQLTDTIPVSLGNLTALQTMNLDGNQLANAIPSQLGNLTNLQTLDLGNNQLTGEIPAELGNLSSLQMLELYWNGLTGAIPAQLGNLTNLQGMYLFGNQLTGTIPAQLGNLANLRNLGLDDNQLSGAIPAELGNLTNLVYLDLACNQLTGAIPASLTSLTNLLSYFNYSGPLSLNNNLSANGLSASGSALPPFLDNKFARWEQTQTIPPASVSISVTPPGSVQVSWTPILYTSDAGYYELGVSQTSGGPYTPSGQTADKTASSIVPPSLPPGAAYFAVRTVTLANDNNQNTVTSLWSTEVSSTVPGLSKASADNLPLSLSGVVVTAAFGDFFYVESPDRSCGIRVAYNRQTVTSGTVNLTGTISTLASGERCINATSVSSTGSGSVTPVGLTNKALGGDSWGYNSTTGAGQQGITGDKGLNNIGLLVKIWGKVTASGRGWFYVDDGSGINDGSGTAGVYVETFGASSPATGAVVSVTGISSCDQYMGKTANTLLATRVSNDGQ